jgi:hypothetical protein
LVLILNEMVPQGRPDHQGTVTMTCPRNIAVLLTVTGLALVAVAWPAAPAPASGGAQVLRVAELRQRIEDRARQLLAVARKGRSWVTPRGVTRWPILIQDELRGSLWENVDLQALTFGDHWRTGDSARLELMHDGRVVGMLWIDHD